jgi:hypothetical protein
LITFKEIEDTLGEALGIQKGRRGHFWGVRGSNAFEDCTILLVVGTPTPNLDEAIWWARALYADDPTPIDTSVEKDDDGSNHFRDRRLRGLLDYLVNAELTQCAHRNRPLRHDGRVVITLAKGEVAALPVTDEYTSLPSRLTEEGLTTEEAREQRNEAALEQAAARLTQQGKKVTIQALAREAKVRKEAASEWWWRTQGAGQQVAG